MTSPSAPVRKLKPPTRKLSFLELIVEMWGPYKQLLPYLKPYRWRFISGILCGAGAGIVSGLLALVIQYVTKKVIPSGAHVSAPSMGSIVKHMMHTGHETAAAVSTATGQHIDSVLWTCALIPAVIILRSLLSYLNAYCIAWVSLKLLNDLRNDIFQKLIHQSLDFFNKSQSGQLMSRVINDARVAQSALTQVSSEVIVQPFTIIGAMGALLYMDWKFTLISFFLFPLCLVPITIFGRKVRRQGMDEEQGTGTLMTVLQEAFTGIRVVKSLARENYEVRDFADAGRIQINTSIRVRKAIEIVGPLIEAISAIGVGLALVYVWVEGITADKFLGLMGGLFILYDPVKKLSKVNGNIQKALASTIRIFNMMHLEVTVKDAPDAKKVKRAHGEITFEGLTFKYRNNLPPAVQDINLRIESGKTYALVGESGSGKSTLLSLILRFYDPQAGCVRLDGVDLRAITQESLRKNIAIVTQDTFLFHTTIMENIRYGRLDATDEEVQAAAEEAFAHDFILAQPKGYQTVVGDKGCLISGGQQQRLAIARALLRNAPILLLDEATSALDSESEQKIQLALERLSAGRTVIAIAHRLSTILKADQIVVMKHGVVMEVGTHSELFEKSGHYRRLYDLQFNRHETEELEAAAEPAATP